MASRFPASASASAPRSVALAAMLAAISPAAAFATDLPLPPMVTKAPPLPAIVASYNWSGLYVGGHLGHLWGRTHVEDNGEIAERNARTDGVVGGVMLGYNWQIQRLVFGLEGDFGWTNAHGVGTGPPEPDPEPAPAPPPPPPPPPVLALPPPPALIPVTTHGPNSYDVRWTSHVRGRIGYAVDNAGHPRLNDLASPKTWMAGTSPAMTVDRRAPISAVVPANAGTYTPCASIGCGV
jgi:opacity protein-like surface antigen